MRMRRLAMAGLVILWAAVPTTSCGGVGEAIGEVLKQLVPQHLPDREGSVSSGDHVETGVELQVGDDGLNRSWRAFGSWEMAPPTEGYVLTGAILRLSQNRVEGDPYDELAPLWVERVDVGDTLVAADYSAPILGAVQSPSDATSENFDVDILTLVQDALDEGTLRLDFRLRFHQPRSFDLSEDSIYLASVASETGVFGILLTWEKPDS